MIWEKAQLNELWVRYLTEQSCAVTNKQMYNDSDEKKWKIGMKEAEKRH